MRLARFRRDGVEGYGVVSGHAIHSLESGPWAPLLPGPVVAELDQVMLLAPRQPSKFVAAGRNYAAEGDSWVPSESLIILQPSSSEVDEPIAHVAAVMTLELGDLTLSRTRAGVGPLQPGDGITVELEGIGPLHSSVAGSD